MRCTAITSFDERYTPSKWDFPNITRPFSIIYYVLGGSAFYKIDGEEHLFKKDHLYVLPANKVFSLRELSDDKFYSVYIHAYTFPEIDKVIEVSVEEDRFLKDTLTMMRKYMRKSDGNYVRRMTDMLLSYVCEKGKGGEDILASKIKTHIESHFVEVFKCSTLTNEFNYSDSHLSRVFREPYDITPKRYAQQLV